MIGLLQEVPKHNCGEYFEKLEGILSKDIEGSCMIIPLYHCEKCDVYDFNGKEFNNEGIARKFIEKK